MRDVHFLVAESSKAPGPFFVIKVDLGAPLDTDGNLIGMVAAVDLKSSDAAEAEASRLRLVSLN